MPKSIHSFILVVFFALPAFGQQSQLDSLATRVAQRITSTGKKKVVVTRFRGNGLIPLGLKLAQDFSAALERQSPGVDILDRTRLAEALLSKNLLVIDAYMPEVEAAIAPHVGAEVIVTGEMNLHRQGLDLIVRVFDVQKQRVIRSEKTRLPCGTYPEDLKAPPIRDTATGVFLAGYGGVGYPECVRCPNPTFTPEARQKQVSATITMLATVSPEGRISNARVILGSCCGLDERAVEAVKTWQLSPALGPDGKPVPVRITIEMNFRVL